MPKLLTIPRVKIGNGFVYDAILRLNDAGSFDIVGYSEISPSGVDSKCTVEKITLEKYKQISDGMTLEQVNRIIGCYGELDSVKLGENGDRSKYLWRVEDMYPKITLFIENNIVVKRAYSPYGYN